MRGKWTKGEWRLAELHAIGMYGNDGAAVILAGDPANASLVANVAAHARFKRGQGHNLTNDPERDANARLIAAAPTQHEAGRKLVNEVAGLRAFDDEIRSVIGNTNWTILMSRLAEMEAALSLAHTKPSQGEK